MTAQQLKNSILQMAVQGKLVPQDPHDEPASVLLDRIRKEKEQLIKEGKIKKEKNPSVIFRGADNTPYEKVGNNEPVSIADEVPFDIPDSWEWVRLQSVCTKLVDGDHNPPKGEVHRTDYIMASSTNINQDRLVDLEKVRYLSAELFLRENERTAASEGDIFFTSVGSLGRSCIFDGSLNICFQRSVSVITTLLYNEYLKYCFDSGYFQNKVQKEATGTAQKGFYLNQLASALIPVPPYDEQVRIVSEIKKYLPLILEYENKQVSLNELNDNFPEQLKKSILQMAVQGKLVPQDPSDEPASVLLERIRAEKERLIKEGKIKRDKNESVIVRRDNSHYEKLGTEEHCIDDEIPCDIPDNWEWARLGTVSTYAQTKKKINAKDAEPNMWGLDLEDIEKGGHLFVKHKVGERKAIGDKTSFEKGDILYSKLRPYLLKVLVADEDGICTPEIVPFKVYGGIVAEYLVAYLKSPYVDSTINAATYGIKMPRAGTETMTALLVPLPPLSEQQRIVKRIKALIPIIESM